MKDIKFRAWDKRNNMMVDLGHLVIDRKSKYNAYAVVGGRTHGNDYEIMQYTGLKDKNGKEIFEGDICKDQHDNHCVGQVVWKTWCWDIPILGDEEDCIPITNRYEVEVIGNIHENPELLEVTK